MTSNPDLAITLPQLHELVQKFTQWLGNNPDFFTRLQHDRYERFQSPDYWRSVSDKELVEEMYQFTRDGGNIQSGGARFANGFRESLQADVDGFRSLVLRLFDEPPPDINQWWQQIRDKFKYFGSGTCSILLHRMFPDRYVVLNVASVVALRRLGLITGTKQSMEKHYARFLEAMKQLVALSDNKLDLRTGDEMMHFLSNTDEGVSAWAQVTGEVLPDEGQRPIWCIRAGEDAKYWKQWKQDGYIAISWPAIGSVTDSATIEDFRKLLIEYYPKKDGEEATEHTHRNNAKALDDFINNMAIDDLVVVTSKMREILGVGKITGEYTYIPDDPSGEQERRRSVTWLKTVPAVSTQDFPTKTLTPLEPNYHTYQDVIRYVGDITEHHESLTQPSELKRTLERVVQLLRHVPNLVLYGPPGTGKTFYAQRLVRHLTGFAEMRKQVSNAGVRYWWVTANPAQWEWDKFPAGGEQAFKFGRIARNYRDVREGDIVFGYQSHPQKKISAVARVKAPPEFDEEGKTVREMLIEPGLTLQVPLLWRDIISDPVLMSSEPVRNGAQGTLFRVTDDEAKQLLTLLREAGNELGSLSQGQAKRWEFVTFHQSYSYEQFVEGLTVETSEEGQAMYRIKDGVFKRLARRAQADPEHDYILIVDEINRGNISKIFGELITLIEKDKRIENSRAAEPERQGIEVTLPYSGEPFGVPANLKIIGTMNTADRSIALLDVALRRRFTFFELMPQYDPDIWRAAGSPVEIEGVHLPRLLGVLNEQIARKLNRDHRIGHAYLLDVMDIKTLRFAWFYRIIPLLSEYFYSDREFLARLLGDFMHTTDERNRQYECIEPTTMTDEQFILALRKQITS